MRTYVVRVGLITGLESFIFGYDTGIITASIAHGPFKTYMNNPNAAVTGAIVATYIAGEAVAADMEMFVGRRRFVQLMCTIVNTGTRTDRSSESRHASIDRYRNLALYRNIIPRFRTRPWSHHVPRIPVLVKLPELLTGLVTFAAMPTTQYPDPSSGDSQSPCGYLLTLCSNSANSYC
ncbi:mfs monosaccharide transporter [Moniliophthora roreri MCA 2997]|uniref:Mfs monosaccharide transporter n=1 Tax=Moniliophthora roreri (strain MCA 2997) TaxID=1381753 RepID=V2YD80_MONRO|nr:mfs monosaccharide transporter [Moniliophthora roreri MCA 2997]